MVINRSNFSNLVEIQGDGPITYSITPALPEGLSFSTSDGTITGTPVEAVPLTPYIVTATNPTGSISTVLNLTVELGMFVINK